MTPDVRQTGREIQVELQVCPRPTILAQQPRREMTHVPSLPTELVCIIARFTEPGAWSAARALSKVWRDAIHERTKDPAALDELLLHMHNRGVCPLMIIYGEDDPQSALLELLPRAAPEAFARLMAEGVPIREQTTSWLLCAFVDALPLEATLRVWDLLFQEGHVVLLRATAAAFQLHERALLNSPEIYELRAVLAGCDPGELISSSLEPRLQKAAAEALAAADNEARAQ